MIKSNDIDYIYSKILRHIGKILTFNQLQIGTLNKNKNIDFKINFLLRNAKI